VGWLFQYYKVLSVKHPAHQAGIRESRENTSLCENSVFKQHLWFQAAAVFISGLMKIGAGAGRAEFVAFPSECKQKTGRDFVNI
jgi:hypothetical protein